jgi:hypothetical protein
MERSLSTCSPIRRRRYYDVVKRSCVRPCRIYDDHGGQGYRTRRPPDQTCTWPAWLTLQKPLEPGMPGGLV